MPLTNHPPTNDQPTGRPPTGRPPRLREGVDFVLENGLLVFTAAYLLRRGDCCDNGCRHCPYGRSPAGGGGGVPDAADS